MVDAIMLCGTMFGLRVLRHRLFETWPTQLVFPPRSCQHVGLATGNHKRRNGRTSTPSFADGYAFLTVAGNNFLAAEARVAMGIDWMPKKALSQAIPPAYTEWLGTQFLEMLS